MSALKHEKPLRRKCYGSIPHLVGSRLGTGDHHVDAGQDRICTVATRDRFDTVIVQEKLDGTNVGVVKLDGQLVPLVRAGYRACDTPYEQHTLFWNWVYSQYERFDALLEEGERVCGEWLAQAHGTRYSLSHEPFVAFDIMKGDDRALWAEVYERCKAVKLTTPHVAGIGPSMSIDTAMERLGKRGWHGASETIEGAVWRVERQGKVDFLAKYVRPDKEDGCYLNAEPLWNWRPEARP